MAHIARLRSAVCVLDRFPALTGIDLDVVAGEVLLVTGSNGAGKTTLLRLLAGLVPLRSGSGEVLGCDLARSAGAIRNKVAFLGHGVFAYDELTARENLIFAAKISGVQTIHAEEVIARVGLSECANVLAGRLSSGQRRRLGLAVALLRRAELVLLDEPHAGLDAQGRRLVGDVINNWIESGATVIMASHESEAARKVASRQVNIVDGRAQLDAPISQLVAL